LLAGLCAAVAAGCQHPRPMAVTWHDALPGGQTPWSYQLRPVEEGRSVAVAPPPPMRRPLMPVRYEPVAVQRPEPVAVQRPLVSAIAWQPTPASTWATAPVRLVSPQLVAAVPRPLELPRRFESGYAADYGWLVGHLQFDRTHDRWTVRYAERDSVDRYGGEIELVHTGPMAGFHPGQRVRVEGDLVDPAPMEIRPAYRVRSLQVVQP
jgi:hypothetical protein